MWAINYSWIRGLSAGLEYTTTEDGMFIVVLDLLVLRLCYCSGDESLFDDDEYDD